MGINFRPRVMVKNWENLLFFAVLMVLWVYLSFLTNFNVIGLSLLVKQTFWAAVELFWSKRTENIGYFCPTFACFSRKIFFFYKLVLFTFFQPVRNLANLSECFFRKRTQNFHLAKLNVIVNSLIFLRKKSCFLVVFIAYFSVYT